MGVDSRNSMQLRFSGTSYLGLDRHPQYLDLVKEGIDRYGTHYGGSRLSPHSPAIFEEAEHAFTAWTNAPAALLTSSGTTAGQLAVRFLSKHYDSIHFSPFAHPASWWPAGVQYNDWEPWVTTLQEGRTVGCTDGVNALAVGEPPWERILPTAPPALMIDDSHLLGCCAGKQGGSWESLRQLYSGELLINASLAKAFALPAGLLLGEQEEIQHIRDLPQFGGASPPAPAYLHAWLNAQDLIMVQFSKLQQNLSAIQKVAQQAPDKMGMLTGFPVIRLFDHTWVDYLLEKGIEVSSFPYPKPSSMRYSRIVIRADHSTEAIEYLVDCLQVLIGRT